MVGAQLLTVYYYSSLALVPGGETELGVHWDVIALIWIGPQPDLGFPPRIH